MDLSIIDISQQLLLAAKTKEPTDSLINIIKSTTELNLETQLNNDKSFLDQFIQCVHASDFVEKQREVQRPR